MKQTLNLSKISLQILHFQAYRRDISCLLSSQDSLLRIIELSDVYTEASENALVYLEVPLESREPLDVQFCLTECLRVPESSAWNLHKHRRLLAYAEAMGERVGADFAFDAANHYAAAPSLYAYLPRYAPELAEGFFAAVEEPEYGKICRNIIARAPSDYSAYYVGLMQSREPAYARIGFRHSKAQARYQKDIHSFVEDLQALGYNKPLSACMQQELREAAAYGFLQDTQLSIYSDGTFADMLAMDCCHNDRSRAFPELNLIENAEKRASLAKDLAKCCFTVQTQVCDVDGVPGIVTLRSFIQYIKCAWINGVKGPLKAYLALSATMNSKSDIL